MRHPLIGVVGPCGAGKTTLIQGLSQQGFHARHIAQEHSYVKDMWQRLAKPDILVFLDVSYPLTIQRRRLNWTIEEYEEQQRRLSHARQHADFYLDTDSLSPLEVLQAVVKYIEQRMLTSSNQVGGQSDLGAVC